MKNTLSDQKMHRRLKREKVTISKMVALYCRHQHKSANQKLCDICQALETYAHQRIDRCPFGAGKPTCAQCPVHCYRPQERQTIRQVMRYAGPRMLWHHPILTLGHLIDSLRFSHK